MKYADKRYNAKPCNINIGNKVIVRRQQKSKALPYDPNPYIVYSKKDNMIITRRDGHAITRNNSFFKKVSQNMLDDSYSKDEKQKN